MSKPSTEEAHMRVCIIPFMFLPILGGAEMQALKQAKALQEKGHDVTIMTLRHDKRWPREELIKGVRVVRTGGIYRGDGTLRLGRMGRPPIDLAFFWKLWQMRHQFDVLHSMQMSSIGTMATLICQLIKKPMIISIQSAGPNEEQARRLREHGPSFMIDTLTGDTGYLDSGVREWIPGDVENLSQSTLGGSQYVNLLRKSETRYQVLSTRSREYLIKRGFRADNIILIPNGVDIERFRPAPTRPDPTNPERPILSVARLDYVKGNDVLLHAWKRMMAEPAEWRVHLKPRLLLVGDGAATEQMKRLAQDLDILESVEFLGSRRDVIALSQQAWGFVLPSRWEGMPNALIEAMACGLPCVATRVSGSEDLLVDGVNGLLVPPEEPAEMAKALRRIIEEPALAQRLAEQARATIVRDYQISSIVEQCLRLYEQIYDQNVQRLPLALGEGGKL